MAGSVGRRNEMLIVAIASGNTVEESARKAGISDRTAWRRLKDPDFRARIAETRARLFKESIDFLSGASLAASQKLMELLNESDRRISLAAAKSILEVGSKLRQATDLEEIRRMFSELEQRIPSEKGR